MTQEVAELNEIRLDEGWTYGELATRINDVAGGELDASTLHRLFNDPARKPYDRTLHKIKKFLDARKAEAQKKGATSQRARSSAADRRSARR